MLCNLCNTFAKRFLWLKFVGYEKGLNNVEGERDSLKTKSGKSDQTNKRQLEKKRKLKTNNKQVKEERNEAIEPNKAMVEQIQKLEDEKKELEMMLNGQTDLKTENKYFLPASNWFKHVACVFISEL